MQVLHSVHALQRRHIKGRRVSLSSSLVVVGYDVLPHVVVLEG